MGKFVKVIVQIWAIYSPLTYWNVNFDTIDSKEGLGLVIAGSIAALVIEWIYKFILYLKA